MKALVTGAAGQLGRMLVSCAPPTIQIMATDRMTLDVTSRNQVHDVIDSKRPEVIVNCAAYTAVDRAESQPHEARLINATAVGWLAEAAREVSAHLVHVSTDYVFGGRAAAPYPPEASPAPQCVYGVTKREGELLALATHGNRTAIIRTSWLYSSSGENFCAAILKTLSQTGEARVVFDQVGAPTSTRQLSQAIWRLVELGSTGIFHWSAAGVASWYDFAVAIAEEAERAKLIHPNWKIRQIRSEEYPTAAIRPSYSVLDCSSTAKTLELEQTHWRSALRQVLGEMSVA